MKRYYKPSDGHSFNYEKQREKQWRQEQHAGGFRCAHCKQFVVINDAMGTANRNHCTVCLWSKHVDNNTGDRRATCKGGMRPIGLTFKHEGRGRTGEIMLIHLCLLCNKLSINRLARDDPDHAVLEVFMLSKQMPTHLHRRCSKNNIYVVHATDEQEVHSQLFGLCHPPQSVV